MPLATATEIIFMVLTIAALCPTVSACPTVCDCQTISTGLSVDCSARSLQAVPSNIPVETALLYLYQNSIGSLTEDSFTHMSSLKELYLYGNKVNAIPKQTFWNLTRLEILHLAENNITALDPELFKSQENLRELHLQQNNLTSLPSNIFSFTTKLQFLYLYDNGIGSLHPDIFNTLLALKGLYLQKNRLVTISSTVFNSLQELELLDLSVNELENIEPDTFLNLTSLKTLYLQSNFLTVLQEYSFKDLPSLATLDIYDNRLAVIKQDAFYNLRALTSLQLHFNSIACNCSIQWFRSWLLARPSLGTAEATCQSSGMYITDLTEATFKDCDKYSIDIPPSSACDRDGPTSITCSLIGQEGRFNVWYHYKTNVLINTFTGSLTGNTNKLAITGCTVEDIGNYICSWTTGTVFSQNINGTSILTMKVDLQIPSTTVTNVTSTMILTCNLTSTGLVPNGWTHSVNGTVVRNLAGSLQDHVNVLTLPFCSSEDSGQYMCKWKGDEGRLTIINKKTDLSVNGPPIIEEKALKTEGDNRILNVLFFSNPHFLEIDWAFKNETLMSGQKYGITTTHTTITTIQYDVIVDRPGFVSQLTIKSFDSTQAGVYYFTVHNLFGSSQESIILSQASTPSDDTTNPWITVVIVLIVLLVLGGVVCCCVIFVCCCRDKHKARQSRESTQVQPTGSDGYLMPGELSVQPEHSTGSLYTSGQFEASIETNPKEIDSEGQGRQPSRSLDNNRLRDSNASSVPYIDFSTSCDGSSNLGAERENTKASDPPQSIYLEHCSQEPEQSEYMEINELNELNDHLVGSSGAYLFHNKKYQTPKGNSSVVKGLPRLQQSRNSFNSNCSSNSSVAYFCQTNN